MSEFDETPVRRKPQFSLRTMLLLFVVVAIALSLWVSYRESREQSLLKQEIHRLKSEYRELTITPGEEDQLHLIRMPTDDDLTWKWRVYVPLDQKRRLVFVTGKIPQTGDAIGHESEVELFPGEQVVMVSLRRNQMGPWEWYVQTRLRSDRRRGAQVQAPQEVDQLMTQGQFVHKLISHIRSPEKVSGVQPKVELMRLRLIPSGRPGSPFSLSLAEGIQVWICDK